MQGTRSIDAAAWAAFIVAIIPARAPYRERFPGSALHAVALRTAPGPAHVAEANLVRSAARRASSKQSSECMAHGRLPQHIACPCGTGRRRLRQRSAAGPVPSSLSIFRACLGVRCHHLHECHVLLLVPRQTSLWGGRPSADRVSVSVLSEVPGTAGDECCLGSHRRPVSRLKAQIH